MAKRNRTLTGLLMIASVAEVAIFNSRLLLEYTRQLAELETAKRDPDRRWNGKVATRYKTVNEPEVNETRTTRIWKDYQ